MRVPRRWLLRTVTKVACSEDRNASGTRTYIIQGLVHSQFGRLQDDENELVSNDVCALGVGVDFRESPESSEIV